MPRWQIVRRLAAAALALGLAACAGRQAPPVSAAVPADAAREPDIAALALEARGAVALFLAAEAEGSAAADTLLAAGADFLMTGIRVTVRPRLAGLNGPGQAVLEEATTGLAGSFAYLVVGYRFTGRTPDLAERARATFVLEKQRAGWKIRHVHSSMVSRW
jgi:ketosteroid isomerase-like protein